MITRPPKKFRPGRWFLPILLLLAVVEVRGTDFVQARIDGLTNTGDVMAYILPATALGLTVYYKDGEGAREFSESAAITMAVTFGLKYVVNARRPNGDPYSFPSGHAAITFCSAEFLQVRYGWKFGVPAYLFASFVGYSRIYAHEHYFRDVAAGAAIGVVTTHLVTRPFQGWQLQPEIRAGYRGVRASMDF
jgi:membrane-associated phospholipid phosphatase